MSKGLAWSICLSHGMLHCCAFEGGFVFGVGGVAAGGDGRTEVLLHPGFHILRRDAIKGFTNACGGGRFEQCRQTGQQACEAAFRMLAFQLLVPTERRFENLGAQRQPFACAELLCGVLYDLSDSGRSNAGRVPDSGRAPVNRQSRFAIRSRHL